MTWSGRRKTYIILGILIVISIPIFTWLFLLIYKAPTCSDGVQNGEETGMDCGGICQLVCSQDVEGLEVVWFRTFPESEGTVTGVALVENKNQFSEAREVPYSFNLFNEGFSLDEEVGVVMFPPQKRTPIVIRGLEFGDSTVDHVSFTLGDPEGWYKVTGQERMLKVTNEKITVEDGRVKIFADVVNESFTEKYRDIDFFVLAYNQEGTVIGYSTTYLEEVSSRQKEEIFLTWDRGVSEIISRIEIIPLGK